MPQVSRRLINQKTQDKIFNLFISSILKCKSKDLAIELVEDLFTPTEKVMLSKRLSIAYMLLHGYDYRSIAKVLKVSTTTVANVSTWLKIKGKGLRKIMDSIKKDEKIRVVLTDVIDTVQDLIASAPGQNWSTSKRMLWESRRQRQQPF